MEIQGYYTSNACYPASPYQSDQVCELSTVAAEALGAGIYNLIIAPPIDPASLEQLSASEEIEDKLLLSGHYFLAADGRVRSTYFPSPIARSDQPGDYLTPLIAGGAEDINKGKQLVIQFTSARVMGAMNGYAGLENNVRIESQGAPPVYVVDNHQMAYYAWHEAKAMGYIKDGAILIHIDGHQDSMRPSNWETPQNLADAASYTIRTLTVDTFIAPAVDEGLVGQFWDFHHNALDDAPLEEFPAKLIWTTSTFAECKSSPIWLYCLGSQKIHLELTMAQILAEQRQEESVILDIDLDAFVCNSDSLFCSRSIRTEDGYTRTVKFLAKTASQAQVVTIATSPGWAHQSIAIPLARDIVRAIIEQEN